VALRASNTSGKVARPIYRQSWEPSRLKSGSVTRGDLLTALGASASTPIRAQSLSEVPTPESVADTVETAISRALEQRPDLQEQFAEVRLAQAERQQARAAFYPNLSVTANPSARSLYILQQSLPWGHTADLTGGVAFSLNWTLFDGGARRNRLAQAEAHIRQAKAEVRATRDRIEDQVWTAYANLNAAFRQRQAARELVNASTQSYSAALESYNYGVRNLLDVTNAQKDLAQARSTDILARWKLVAVVCIRSFRLHGAYGALSTLESQGCTRRCCARSVPLGPHRY
jgi:outer membrane protein